MDKMLEAEISARYDYRDKFYPAYPGFAARALGLMESAARPAAQISPRYGKTQ
jgi:hypothetical protein